MAVELITLTPQQRQDFCSSLIVDKTRNGFARELGMSDTAYHHSWAEVVERVVAGNPPPNGQELSLVETRIPFHRQRELLGIGLDPAIFYRVRNNLTRNPYAVWLQIVGTTVENLPHHLRGATPLEGINASWQAILDRSLVVALPGGEYEMPGILTGGITPFRMLCLERYLGQPRISQVPLATRDGLVRILAAQR